MNPPANTGVRQSGLADWGLTPEPTARELAARRAKEAADLAAFAETPRGRFLSALKGIRKLKVASYDAASWRAQDAYCRGFDNAALPPSMGELGVAALALSDIPGHAAVLARQALAEIEIEAHRKAALCAFAVDDIDIARKEAL